MPRFARLLLLLIAALPWQPARAWDAPGHRAIAELAERALSPAARNAALALLVDDRAQHLADVANWADQIREQPGFAWSKPLHYVNMADDCRFRPASDCPDGRCIVAAIERYAGELADRSLPRPQRAAALKWLVHLVGDVHEPFHASFARDLGGNRYQVRVDGQGTNLHSAWDRLLPARAGVRDTGFVDRLLRAPAPPTGTLDPVQWAEQSCRLIGSERLYPAGHVLDQAYLERTRPLVTQQLRRAGLRLAALLDQALADDPRERAR